jgi:hypothetical protein
MFNKNNLTGGADIVCRVLQIATLLVLGGGIYLNVQNYKLSKELTVHKTYFSEFDLPEDRKKLYEEAAKEYELRR